MPQPDVIHRTERLPGLRRRASWLEAGHGTPMILIHGLGHSSRAWDAVFPQLSSTHHVVAIDLLGDAGEAEAPPQRDLFGHFVRLLEAVSDHAFGNRRAVVVGHSIGGNLGVRLAVERPDRVRHLVLVAPAGITESLPRLWKLIAVEPLLGRITPALDVVPGPLRRRLMTQVYRRAAFASPGRVDPETVRGFAERFAGAGELAGFLHRAHDLVDGMAQTPPLAELGATGVPTAVIWGRQDRLVPPANARVIRDAIPDAELRYIERCGHCPHLERPRRFLQVLYAILDTDSTRHAVRAH